VEADLLAFTLISDGSALRVGEQSGCEEKRSPVYQRSPSPVQRIDDEVAGSENV
jgi:hypothetical protein